MHRLHAALGIAIPGRGPFRHDCFQTRDFLGLEFNLASGDIDARERLGEDFPTSALALISFAPADWSGVHPQGGRLEHFVTPRWLETATD